MNGVRVSDRLVRIEAIVKQASELPKIDPLPESPTQLELLDGYVRLAHAYAASALLLQQTIPLIIEELQVVRSELALQKSARLAKVVPIRGRKKPRPKRVK